jgi:hypothetical protein
MFGGGLKPLVAEDRAGARPEGRAGRRACRQRARFAGRRRQRQCAPPGPAARRAAVARRAAKDSNIDSVVLLLDELDGGGLASLREVGAAVERVKAAGKTVVAWGGSFDQKRYLVAAHASEVYLHPMGMVMIEGFGRHRNYYRDALDKVGVTVNLMKVGTYKSFAEPFIGNGPSKRPRKPTAPVQRAVDQLHGRPSKRRASCRPARSPRASRNCRSAWRRTTATRPRWRWTGKADRRHQDARRSARDAGQARRVRRQLQELPPDRLWRLRSRAIRKRPSATRSAWWSRPATSPTATAARAWSAASPPRT